MIVHLEADKIIINFLQRYFSFHAFYDFNTIIVNAIKQSENIIDKCLKVNFWDKCVGRNIFNASYFPGNHPMITVYNNIPLPILGHMAINTGLSFASAAWRCDCLMDVVSIAIYNLSTSNCLISGLCDFIRV